MLLVIRSVAFGQPWPGVPAFSSASTVLCSGSCFKVLIRIPYDFATLKRMLGISSFTSLSIIGRMDCSMTSRLRAGARVYHESVYMKALQQMLRKLTETAKQVVMRYR
jgi:hypothetical protein